VERTESVLVLIEYESRLKYCMRNLRIAGNADRFEYSLSAFGGEREKCILLQFVTLHTQYIIIRCSRLADL
jgi:hypothetical protein